MPLSRPQPPATGPLQRVLAGLLAVVVCALVVLAVSPQAHAWLHGEYAGKHTAGEHATPAVDHDDDGCAVTLFAHGVTLPLTLPAVAAPHAGWAEQCVITRTELRLLAPRYRCPPGRGPPQQG